MWTTSYVYDSALAENATTLLPISYEFPLSAQLVQIANKGLSSLSCALRKIMRESRSSGPRLQAAGGWAFMLLLAVLQLSVPRVFANNGEKKNIYIYIYRGGDKL